MLLPIGSDQDMSVTQTAFAQVELPVSRLCTTKYEVTFKLA